MPVPTSSKMSNPLFGNSDEDSSDASSLADGENPLLDSESEDEPDAADTAGASPGGKKKDKKTKGGGALSLLDVVMAGIDIPITAVEPEPEPEPAAATPPRQRTRARTVDPVTMMKKLKMEQNAKKKATDDAQKVHP